MSTGITRDDWLKALDAAGLAQENDQEAVTVAEFAAMFDQHRTTATRNLDKLVAAGKAVKTRKLCSASDGRRASHVAYRLKDRKAKK